VEFFASLIRTIDWGRAGAALHDMIVGLFSGFTQWLKDIDWAKMGSDLVGKIADFFRGLKLGEVLTALAEFAGALFKGVIEAISGVISSLLQTIKNKLPLWFTKLVGGETTQLNLRADIAESITVELNEKTNSFMGKILEKLGVDDSDDIKPLSWQLGNAVAEAMKNGLYLDESLMYSMSIEEQVEYVNGQLGKMKAVMDSMNGKMATYQNTGATGGGYQDYTWGGGGRQTVPHNAAGGTINKGQLFIANEAGPELIGSLNGKTSVTNYDQFTQSVIDANSMVVEAVMQVVAAVNNKDLDVYMDSQKVGQSVTQYQNSIARRFGY
jgi:hypothetical protein